MKKASLAALILLPAACANMAASESDLGEGAGGAPEEAAESAQALVVAPAISERKSLEVTDSDILSRFTLKEVLQQLLTQSGSTRTPSQLFFQMFDAQQPAGSPGAGSGPHCTSTFNGFSFECPRFEGQSAMNLDPFIADQTAEQTYKAVALANRLDLADSAGAHCGQYRLVFARRSGAPSTGQLPTDPPNPGSGLNRNFIIFEAQVPNPSPGQGALGCAPIAQFWQNLSEPGRTPAELGSALHSFYFNGLPASNVGPVIHMNNYGGGGHGGQIRTNQFANVGLPNGTPFQPWLLREFTFNHSCTAPGSCSAVINPATAKVNPSATLFVPGSTDAKAIDFQTNVLLNTSVLTSLATATDLNKLDYNAPDKFNTGESNSLDTGPLLPLPLPAFTAQRTDYLAAFGAGPSTLATQVATKLASIGSTLTPQQLVNRIQSLSCAGCHNVNNETVAKGFAMDHADLGMKNPDGTDAPFPDNGGFAFTHTSEAEQFIPAADGGDGVRKRFKISPALESVFIPFRKTAMVNYVSGLPKRVTATLTFQSTWSGGYCVAVNLQNSGSTATTAWHVDVDLNGTTVTSSWNATASTVAAGDLSMSNISWNGAIPANGALNGSFGFCASRTTATAVPRVLAASGQ